MRRKGKLASGRSPRWAFMERFEVPNYDEEGNYLTRWRILQTPWFAFYLHRFDGPDPRPTLHDHPFNFTAVVLRGGYVERRLNPATLEVDENHMIRFFNRVKAGDAHSIRRLLRYPTWTFLFVGRRVRQWGYVEPIGESMENGWVWMPFDVHHHNLEFQEALARRKKISK
jgi:hypothetical protein